VTGHFAQGNLIVKLVPILGDGVHGLAFHHFIIVRTNQTKNAIPSNLQDCRVSHVFDPCRTCFHFELEPFHFRENQWLSLWAIGIASTVSPQIHLSKSMVVL